MAESSKTPAASHGEPVAESLKVAGTAAHRDSGIDLKVVEKAVEADSSAPAKPVEAAKTVSAAKRSAPKKAPGKARAAKPAPKPALRRSTPAKSTPAKKSAAPRTTPITKPEDTVMATATTTTDFTATAQNTAAEMQNRAKAAFEKGTMLTGEVTEFHKGNLEALVETGKLLASGMQDMGRTYMEDARTAADTVTADVKKMAAIKSPTELFQLQGEIARRNFDAAVAQTSKNTEAMMKLVTEAFAPLSNRASVAAEKVSNAA
jgi:phasin family protein